ncbi:hypothetical protein [Tardiphaga sp.]|uniref:hypothetical protein n=1 Tax=Tardiphaga sp. TaxID=1926292 RepID=UPI00262DC256|nr:hypothetical protein [Tardiphaga sp.]MDB5618785.1 hypothetical protein [Tardiphaga sp.]
MITTLLIALAAGAASALMFASLLTGALIAIPLFYFSPLPLMVAALGWGPVVASIGGIAAATGLGLLFGMSFLAVFVLTVALPAWWLGHLALLGRRINVSVPAANGKATMAPVVEWYPVGRLLLWVAGFAALTTMGALLTLGWDSAAIHGALRPMLVRMMSASEVPPTERNIAATLAMAPAAAALVAIVTLTLNLWIAGRITATSGRLQRPWPDLSATALPPMTLVALCVAIALVFQGGTLGIFATIVSATLIMAFAFTGFAALHMLTQGLKNRALWLGSAYALVTFLVWPIFALVVLGLADALFGIRERFRLRGLPPPPPVA